MSQLAGGTGGKGSASPGLASLPPGAAAELRETFPPATRAIAFSAVEQIKPSSGLVLPYSNPTAGCRSLAAPDSSTKWTFPWEVLAWAGGFTLIFSFL